MDDGIQDRIRVWEGRLVEATRPYRPDGADVTDIHVHMGIDAGTGHEMTLEAIEAQMQHADIDRAVLIPLHASDGYRQANERLAEVAADSGGRFRFLARVDPDQVDAAGFTEALDAGAVGVKLHPESDNARPADPRLRPILEQVAERGGIALVHAGIDVDGVSTELIEVARQLPDANFVAGHIAADRMAGIARALGELDNLFVCTAWWGAQDIAWAMSWSDPSRFVFGSDPPFGSMSLGAALTTRVARCIGYDDAAVAAVLGGSTGALLDGTTVPRIAADPELDTDASKQLLGRLPAPWQRAYVSMQVSAALAEGKADPSTQLKLAKAALEHEVVDDRLAPDVELLVEGMDLALALHEQGEGRAAYIISIGVACLAATTPLLRG